MARARKLHTYGIAPAVNREGQRASPSRPSTTPATTTGCPTCRPRSCGSSWTACPTLLAARAAAAEGYAERLDDVDGITLPVVLADRTHPWQSYLVTTDATVDRDAVVMALRERGVGSNFGTYASHVQPVYGSTDACPVSLQLFERQLALPMHANLVDDDLDYVADQLRLDPRLAEAAARRDQRHPPDGRRRTTGRDGRGQRHRALLRPPGTGPPGRRQLLVAARRRSAAPPRCAATRFVAELGGVVEEGGVEIGSRNVLKEFVSVNTGWAHGDQRRRRLPVHEQAHLAHDTQTGDRVTVVRRGGRRPATSSSRTTPPSGSAPSSPAPVIVPAGAMVGMQSAVTRDLPPYVVSMGVPARPPGSTPTGSTARGPRERPRPAAGGRPRRLPRPRRASRRSAPGRSRPGGPPRPPALTDTQRGPDVRQFIPRRQARSSATRSARRSTACCGPGMIAQGPEVAAFEPRVRRADDRGPHVRRGQLRHLGPAPRPARRRHRPGRRGDRPVLHLRRDGQLGGADRRHAGLRRHRARPLLPAPTAVRPRSPSARPRSCRSTSTATRPTWTPSRVADEHGLRVFEDAAQAHLAHLAGRPGRHLRRLRDVQPLPHQEHDLGRGRHGRRARPTRSPARSGCSATRAWSGSTPTR